MTTARTMGHHENSPNISSIGSMKSSVLRPPRRTHVAGVLLVGFVALVAVVALVAPWGLNRLTTLISSRHLSVQRICGCSRYGCGALSDRSGAGASDHGSRPVGLYRGRPQPLSSSAC